MKSKLSICLFFSYLLIARVSLKGVSKDGQDGMPDLFAIVREYCPTYTMKTNEGKDGLADDVNFSAIYGKSKMEFSLFADTGDKSLEKEWDARLEYARLLSNLERFDESLEQYQKLLAEKPDSIVVRSELAQLMYYQGKEEKALEFLEKIPVQKLDDKGRILMGDIYVALKHYPKAEAIYQEQLAKDPMNDSLLLKLAEIFSWQKKYDASIELYQQILSRHPDDIQVRRKYALVLMWMGNDKEAADELEKTLR